MVDRQGEKRNDGLNVQRQLEMRCRCRPLTLAGAILNTGGEEEMEVVLLLVLVLEALALALPDGSQTTDDAARRRYTQCKILHWPWEQHARCGCACQDD